MSERLKIAFVDPASFTLAYDANYVNALVDYVDVDFYCSETSYGIEHLEKIDSAVKINIFKVSGSITSRVVGLFSYFKMLTEIYLARDQYAAIHFNWSILPILDSVLLPVIFGKKLIFTVHNFMPHNMAIQRKGESRLRRKSRLVAVSDYVYRKLSDIYDDVFFLQHGTTTARVMPSQVPPSRLLFIGRVVKYKGVHRFINLARNWRGPEQFEVWGKWDSEMLPLLPDAECHAQVANGFLMTTEFEELFSQPSALVVLPYDDISQSGVLYDVTSSCVPFIASRRGGFIDFAEKLHISEVLFDPDDLQDMTRAARFAINNHLAIRQALYNSWCHYDWQYDVSYLDSLYNIAE